MSPKQSETQAFPRRESRIAIPVTAREKEALRVVAEARGVAKGKRGEGHANLLRTMGLDEVVAEYERLRRVVLNVEAA